MLTTDTKRRIDNCRDYLVGKLPLPTDQVELITLALIYKFMDDMDEDSAKLGGKRAFFTGLLTPYRWRAVMAKTLPAKDRMDLFAAGLEALGDSASGAHLPPLFRDIFGGAFLKFRDGKTFALFAAEIDGFAYSHSDGTRQRLRVPPADDGHAGAERAVSHAAPHHRLRRRRARPEAR